MGILFQAIVVVEGDIEPGIGDVDLLIIARRLA